uniref:Sema domain-containing protein n=1 Tax=Scleropages formosus TaxID=113540 RepID=A0A8C9TM89_SCLFO
MAWWTLAVLLLSLSIVCCAESIQEFTSSTLINNVVQDPLTGHIYVGAINAIYQLDSLLRQEKKVETGPKRDSRHCTPPIQSCHDAKMTDNTNKLLLVHPSNGSLIVCGSLFKGICSLRKLGSIDHLIYCNDSKGEKAYVVSSEETVSVVGVMSTFTKENDTFDVFVVGKGYGSQGNMKLISTRILQDFGNWDVFEDIVEAPAVQVTPFVKKYRHNFRYSFKESGFIYFLFTRTRGGLHNKNYTFISRLCEDDHHYYSYMELQLSCGPNNMYNKAQAAFVSSPGEELARNLSASGQYGQVRSQDKILFVVSSTDEDKPRSGLCMYPLRYINQRIMEIISACYTKNGKIGNKVAVDSPYTTSANLLCSVSYKCSADFLPSPLASTPGFALAAQAVHTTRDLLMAVAVAVEAEHTVAFLGTSNGKVYHMSTAVNKHLLFDRNHRHLYVTTGKKISMVPVEECDMMKDCKSCMDLKDPYCGWCALEGRCTRKSDCRKAEEEKHWLWSPQNQCVEITSFQPPNLSCKKMQKVDINVASLPSIGGDDSLKCIFGNFESEAKMGDSKVTCDLPKVTEIPVTPKNKDFVQVATKIFVNDEVELASSYFTFYNCSAAARQAENTPCMSCVDSEWSCQWNTQEFICDDRDDSVGDHIIKHKEVRNECPVFENPTPSLIPVGYETSIEFTGKNLRVYEVKDFSSYLPIIVISRPLRIFAVCKHRMLMLLFLRSRDQFAYDEVRTVDVHFYIKDRKTHKKIDSKLNVTLYNCAVGREDCSLCKSADPMYSCVWCDKTKSCEYRKRCPSGERRRDCPNPEITDIIPQYGPLKGGISVTIKGSNLGIVKEDIESIRVAGEPCVHQEEKYFVSTSVVCEIGGVQQKQSGVVEVKVKGGKSGTSSVMFTYRDPRPERVQPNRGPRAGGTLITITGTDLETGTKDDVSITVGGVVCIWSCLNAYGLILLQLYRFCFLQIKFGHGQWIVGSVEYEKKIEASWTSPLDIIIPAVIAPMVGITIIIIIASVCCYRKQAEREYEKLRQQLENLEGSVRDRCKKEFTELMIEMEDHTADLSEPCIPFLDYKTYADRVFFLPFKDSASDVMITGKLDIPEARRATVMQALNQFLNLLNSKPFLLSFIRTLEGHPDFNAQSKGYFASLLTVALHGKLDYYTDIMRTLLLELMEQYARSKNPKLMLHRSETVVEKMLCNWMSICLYQFLKDSAGEPLYKLFKAVKHQVEKGPVDAVMKKAKYTLNDTDLLGDDVEYCTLTLQVLVHGEGPGVTLVKVLNCDTISQVTEKILEQVYKNVPYSQRPKMESVTLESAGQILSDLDLTSQKEGRWKRMNTLAHYDVRDNATLVLSRVLHPLQSYDQHQDRREVRNALLEEDKVFHLVQPAEEVDEVKSKRGNMKDKSMTKAITELYLMRLLSVKGTLQQFVDDFFRSVLCSSVGPPAVKYFFDFLDEQAQKHDNVDDQTIDIWKTSSLPLRFWVNILRNPHFIFDIHVNEVVDASLFVIVQTFMDACTKSERKLSRDSPNHKLLYAKEISTYKKMVEDYYKGIREMVPVSNQHMNTHLAKVSRSHKDKLSTQVALHQLYQYANKYYDVIITSFDEDPAAQNKQLALRLQQIVAVLENKVTDP